MCGFETRLSELLTVTLLIYQLNCVGHGSEMFKIPQVFEAQNSKVLFLASFMHSLSLIGRLYACGHSGKEPTCNAGDAGSIPASGRFPREGMTTHSIILAWKSLGQWNLGLQRGCT